MSRIIALLSGKGGVGKTTITANLGVGLAYDYKKRVIAIDANTTSCCLGFHLGRYTFATTLNDILKKRKDISEAIYHHPSNLFLIPSSPSILDLDANPYGLKENVNLLRQYTDVILLDGAPTLGTEAYAVLEACDEVIIVTNPERPAILEAMRIERLAMFKKKKILGVIVNKVKKWNKKERAKVETKLKSPILGYIVDDGRVSKSVDKGIPIVHYHPNSRVAKNIRELLTKITGEEFPRKNNGFISKVVSLFKNNKK